VGDSESETFWAEFIASLEERGLSGVKLMVSDVHVGLSKAIRRQLQGYVWQRCRILSKKPVAPGSQGPTGHGHRRLSDENLVEGSAKGVDAGQPPCTSLFAQESAAEICIRWDELATSLAERFPKAAELLNEAREDVLAFKAFPKPHWR